jgi:YebC/PmpR family DNA-binding regulatory protein
MSYNKNMSGHSHWAGIKHKKEITDKKRGKLFSKLVKAITAAAATESSPDFNPRLRSAIAKAKEFQVPIDTINNAIEKASGENKNLNELIYEAYGPGGVAILIEIVTDNRNRTVAEIKKIISDNNGKWADQGGVRWAFDAPDAKNPEWKVKFPIEITDTQKKELEALIESLIDHDDVQRVYVNTTI